MNDVVEAVRARRIADKWLAIGDPDSDATVLARQYRKALERIADLEALLTGRETTEE